MKHIRDFNTLQEAKAATLYSPVLTRVAEGENSKLLMLSTGIADAKCKITGNTLDDVKVVLDDPKYQYLTIEPMAEGTTFYLFKRANPTITKTVDLKYSLDEGKTWTQYTMPAAGQNGASIPIPMGSKLLLKGNNETGGFNDCYTLDNVTYNNKQAYYILGIGQQYVHGNLLSLVYGDDFIGKTSYPNDGCFARLFQSNTVIKKADIYVTTDNNKYTGLSMFSLASAGSILETAKITGKLVGDGCSSMFYQCSALQSVDFTGCDLSSVTNMYVMFYKCSALQSVYFTGCDLSNVTDMRYMFEYCSALQSVDFTGCDLSSVTNMYAMFNYCSALQSVDFTGCDLSSVTDMSYMFAIFNNTSPATIECVKLKSSVYHDCILSSMFCGARVKNVDFSEFKVNATESSWFFGKSSGGICGVPYVETMDLSGVNSSKTDATKYGSPELNGSDLFEFFDDRYTWSSLKSLKFGKGAINTLMGGGNYYLAKYIPNVTDKHAVALNIVQSLGTITTGKTYYLGDAYLNTLSEAEKQIAIDKGWTLQGDAPALTSAMPPMTTATAPNEVEHDIECPTPPDNEAMM